MSRNVRPSAYSFTRYLTAKRSVDDRALNARLWQRMVRTLTSAPPARPHTLLEVGGGIGTMIERLLAEPGLPPLQYHLLDANPANIEAAVDRLGRDSATIALDRPLGVKPDTGLTLEDATGQIHQVFFYATDLFKFLDAQPDLTPVSLLIAHAFLDLMDVPATLARFINQLSPATLLYFTINFDGATIFEPAIDPAFDAHVEALYHRTMDERITAGQPSGDSHTGRHLFHALAKAGIDVLDAGSSDWFVLPHAGQYPDDEAFFLHFIVHTMRGALGDHPELDQKRFAQWIETRHRQIEAGELIYIAHQLDYLARIP